MIRATALIGLAMSAARYCTYPLTPKMALFLITTILLAGTADAEQLRVTKKGLGLGTITSSPGGISCGADCDQNYANGTVVTLTATPDDPYSVFVRWELDATGLGASTTVTMSANRSVRAVFDLINPITPLTDLRPGAINTYLLAPANAHINTPARFLAALPVQFKWNWLLMTRSESLQTGVAGSPRVLLPSEDATAVFTIGLMTHPSYPGSDPNAVEYMQWDALEKNFRFHEIVLAPIPDMGDFVTTAPSTTPKWTIPARTRGVGVDDAKCAKCHSTRNVYNRSSYPGTTGVLPGTVKWKNKPNWDPYDSWAGLMPFNRDRIYQGSVEAAAFRKLLNLWTWSTDDTVRPIIEQLALQPPLNGTVPIPAKDVITRTVGGANDGHINFVFDGAPPEVLSEPAPAGTAVSIPAYSFDGLPFAGTATVRRDTTSPGLHYVTLHHSGPLADDEGRATQLFDLLGGLDGTLNQQRIADELINHRFATGSFPIDVRPIALAIAKGWVVRSGSTVISTVGPALTVNFPFFNARHGLTPPVITALVNDTRIRAESVPRRKADRQKKNLDRSLDEYLWTFAPSPVNGLIQEYGAATTLGAIPSMSILRQEVFRRLMDAGSPDSTVMGGIYVDREQYSYNTERVALFRYFLEPLGVSVDKWSMGVRGRSRTYAFADVFDDTYIPTLIAALTSSLTPGASGSDPIPGLSDPTDGAQVIAFVNSTLSVSSLPGINDCPTFTDVQRIFNKGCIECHGGLLYPPYRNFLGASITDAGLDLSEDESPTTTTGVSPRLARSYAHAVAYIPTSTPTDSYLFKLITRTGEGCPPGPLDLMPCGGPALNAADIETIRRWIACPPSPPFTVGDTHIRTVTGVNYDFQAVGEFVLLRDEYLELQARQTAVRTDGPLGPNDYTGLTSCVSVNTAVAIRIGNDRISYQPHISGQIDPTGMQLRINGRLTPLTSQPIPLASGGRVTSSTAPGGVQVEAPGGAVIVVTPGFWNHYQLWYLNVDARNVRATMGLMGATSPRSWLPALPDGTLMGPKPASLQQRYTDLYEVFGNAWRVTDTTSLFDYAPDTGTETFTIPSWPNGISNQVCIPPPQPGVSNRPPQQPLPLAEAQQACSGIIDPTRRAKCMEDVMVTGERGFATTYLRADQIARNKVPKAPELVFPADFPTNLFNPVTFTWNPATDQDGDPISYKLYIWRAGQIPNNNNAEPVLTLDTNRLSIKLEGGLAVIEWAAAGAQLETASSITGPWDAIPNAVSPYLVFPDARSQFYRLRLRQNQLLGQNPLITKTISNLQSGIAYFWKVIAEDGKGGTIESETRRFDIK